MNSCLGRVRTKLKLNNCFNHKPALFPNRRIARVGARTRVNLRVAQVAPLLLALAAAPLPAATEFEDSVPVELAKLFLGNPGIGEATLYRDVMDDFPPFTVPAAFEVLGSLDQVYLQRVILRTDLDADAATAALTAAFTANGWQLIDLANFGAGQRGGFVSAAQPQLPVQICHDDYGMLQVQVSTSADGKFVNLNRSRAGMMGGSGNVDASMSPCDPARFGMMGPMGPGARGGVIAHMPTLVVPEAGDALRSMPSIRGGGGGSPNDWESSTPLASELSLQQLYEHFAPQLIAQGWALDSVGTGSFLATGSFTKTVEGDMELIGILNVLELAENSFDLKFRLVSKTTAAGGPGPLNSPAIGIRRFVPQ